MSPKDISVRLASGLPRSGALGRGVVLFRCNLKLGIWRVSSQESILKIAFSWPVVRRALTYALIVGFVLTMINHGDCLMAGHFDLGCGVQTVLTSCVPYVVSTLSSVQALRSRS